LRYLCEVGEIDPESGKEVVIGTGSDRRYIAVFRVADGVRAYLNSCPHQGRSLNWAPDQFLVETGGTLVCPHHGACFELETGECKSGPCQGARLTAVQVLVEHGKVEMLPDESTQG